MAKITYADKSYIEQNPSIPVTNKVCDTDMNEIKSVVNNNDDSMNAIPEIIVDGDKTSIKYPSGLMINTIKFSYSNVSVGNQWGGIYASATTAVGDYKTPFVALYSVNITCKSGIGNHWLMETEDAVTMTTTAPKVQFLRGATGTATGTLYVTAIGTWK